jgi:uncharacterized membrane protein YeaQ/YmgE (transglycosylase-associated protein family)
LFGTAVLGLVVGIAARWVVPGDAPGGVLGDCIVGIIGAIAGGWLYMRYGLHGSATQNSLPGMVCAFIGAVVLLSLMRAVSRPSPTS